MPVFVLLFVLIAAPFAAIGISDTVSKPAPPAKTECQRTGSHEACEK